MRRGVTAEIDLAAAKSNLIEIKKAAGNLPLIAVVKADAYGHGAVELSRLYEKAGAHSLAVAFVSEARGLREAGINLPILVLFDKTDIPAYFDLNLTPVLHDMRTAGEFSREAGRRNTAIGVHVKVDTGMGRMGLGDPGDVEKIAGLENLGVTGLLSHFSEADLADMEYMELQLERFEKIKSSLAEGGIKPLCHIANSAAALCCRKSHLDAVRPGLALYGISPFEDGREGLAGLRPVMRVTAKVLSLRKFGRGRPVSYGRTFITQRDTLAAVIAVGYADGYTRAFSNNAEVLLNGKRAPVIGRVCMDLMVVDATEAGDPEEQDEAVLLGPGGGDNITAWELARRASTIPYEILTSMGRGAEKTFSGADAV